MALIVVIWMMAFLGIVLSAFAFSMRTELDAARSFTEETEAAALAEAGIARAVTELMDGRLQREGLATSAVLYDSGEVSLGRGTYRVVVTDEDGKIAINSASAEVLARLFQNSGLKDRNLLRTIVDSILDWRDADHDHRLYGAEREYYRSLPQPYYPRNGAFPHLDELLLVKGMQREILDGNVRDAERLAALLSTSPEDRVFQPGEYLGVRRFLTVSGGRAISTKTASPDVLVASAGSAVAGKDGRQTRFASRQANALARFRAVSGQSGIYLIESVGSLTGARVNYPMAVTVQGGATATGFQVRVLSWTEGS